MEATDQSRPCGECDGRGYDAAPADVERLGLDAPTHPCGQCKGTGLYVPVVLDAQPGVDELSVYTDGYSWVIATNEEDALIVWCENSGEKPDDYRGQQDWDRLDDARLLTIWCDGKDNPCDPFDGAETQKACGEWKKRGRGFLCTTEI
jgi:hypothetical protein